MRRGCWPALATGHWHSLCRSAARPAEPSLIASVISASCSSWTEKSVRQTDRQTDGHAIVVDSECELIVRDFVINADTTTTHDTDELRWTEMNSDEVSFFQRQITAARTSHSSLLSFATFEAKMWKKKERLKRCLQITRIKYVKQRCFLRD